MNLHEEKNKKMLAEAVRFTAARFNVPQTYVEKDYFLTKALLHISKSEYCNNIVFKGGTSLSKVYKAIYRFSEDIDLAILPADSWSDRKIKKVIKSAIDSAAKDLTKSTETTYSHGSKYRKERYYFPRLNTTEALGEVQDSILFECNAYTTPSPAVKQKIRSLIAEWAIKEKIPNIIETFQLQDFEMLVLCWKRTYCEKILGLMAAASRNELNNKVRHFYDLTMLYRNQDIIDFIDSEEFYYMMSISIKNDIEHAGGREQPWIKSNMAENQPFSEFSSAWTLVESAYSGDFQAMITRPNRTPDVDEIAKVFETLHSRLNLYSQTQLHSDCLAAISTAAAVVPINQSE
ncbi:nucleotidyl transferase AbiEii/AbiGii toxin family protein [Aeromonas veronii]|uniref:nucleotidyl transferase AbiEii/AbiGii toxin family protein n=1 Tax=Aeromonas veronii TaxID=654 RepID=UPI001F332578|nr:nucleotidyl transferase AbiEii/AbiGii toxin family protein [Aeromonas veronii]MCF5880685.1 nucleotidyl transferase AbiEii/AbiGii toxin family protein [Aeromonas veronii]